MAERAVLRDANRSTADATCIIGDHRDAVKLKPKQAVQHKKLENERAESGEDGLVAQAGAGRDQAGLQNAAVNADPTQAPQHQDQTPSYSLEQPDMEQQPPTAGCDKPAAASGSGSAAHRMAQAGTVSGSPSLIAAAAARLAALPSQQQVDQEEATSPEPGSAAAAAAASPGMTDSQQSPDEIEDDDNSSDGDFEQPPAGKQPGNRTAAVPRRQRQQQQQHNSSGGAGTNGGSEASADDISSADDDADEDDHHQLQQRQPAVRQQHQQKAQQQPATGRARRAAAVAATDRMRGLDLHMQQQEQEQQPARRSTRIRRGAAAAAGDDAPEEAAVVRPRRAAAAAAKEATAAALAAEAAPATWASQPDGDDDSDSYLGTPDASDAEEAAADLQAASSSDAAVEDESDDRAAGSDGEGDSWDDDGSGKARQQRRRQQQQQQQQATRQQPKPGRGGRAVIVDDSSEDDDEDDGSPSAAVVDASDDADADADDQPLDLNTFRFKGQAAAAAGAKKRRGSSGNADGSGADGGEAADAAAAAAAAATAAALQAEAELCTDVADASTFTPLQLAKLPRGQDVDKLLAARYEEDDSVMVLGKLVGKSYRRVVWLPAAAVEAKRPALLRNFLSRHAGGETDTDWLDNNNINPTWYKVDRVVAEYTHARQAPMYLIKWCGLEYSDCTWEDEEELCLDGAGQVALARYKRWSTPPQTRPTARKRPRQELLDQKLLPAFKNGRKLRDYQEESLHWMINNYRGQIVHGRWRPRNCILGDEMGLGKTAQSISVISWLKQYAGASAPCMVVAPLTTLGHWKREVETWTDLNVVLYAGSAEDRRLIREHEFYYPRHKSHGVRFDVLLSSYETVLKDKTELKKLKFEALIVDEAHRLKNQKSATRLALEELSVHWLLMLSGTPVQNNMRELQGLMSLLDADAYGDVDHFLVKYGSDTPNLEQIRALQAALAPVLLRRMKEDVEDLPEKEEVVIWVELTQEQRRYYRALYSQQIGALLGGGANKNLPGMRNLAMELRKLCCHPFLCDGLEDDMTLKWAAAQAAAKTAREQEIENYTRASGKMLLLHKLLPKLRAEGRQVLIFSQFKMMLDVIEDYLIACGHPFERIDGDTKHSDRQAAIDRFMAGKANRQHSKTPSTSRGPSPSPAAEAAAAQPEAQASTAGGDAKAAGGSSRDTSPAADEAGPAAVDGPFVFLLSTRAGGQGITLTSADTVIIYDSDWNPQNDLQAMARCHRIGQEKEVTVYRLVSKNTYEQQLFECASRKYGLDEAILGFSGSGDNPENDAARIEQLLRLGAHALLQGGGESAGGAAAAPGGAAGGEAAAEEKGFAAEDIEQILLGRSEKRQLGSRKGNTFSIAHFGDGGGELEAEPEQEEQDLAAAAPKDAKAFWAELLPEAVADHAAAQARQKEPQVLGPRRRRQVDYREACNGPRTLSSSSDITAGVGQDGEGDDDDDDDGIEGPTGRGRGAKRAAEDDGQGSGGKKAKRKGDDGGVFDPELGRVVVPWKASHVEAVREALLRYGMDRLDKVVAQCQQLTPALRSREADEIHQLCRAIAATLEGMQRLAPALHEQDKAAKGAALAALASGNAAAAGQLTGKAGSNNLSSQYVNNMRDGLVKAGLEQRLPPACKALVSLDAMRRMGRAPGALQSQLRDHHKVHLAMVAAGLAGDATAKAAPAAGKTAAGDPQEEQQQQQEGGAPFPAKAQPAAAAAAAGAAGGGGGDSAAAAAAAAAPATNKRLAPRVLAKGSKGLPGWWTRDHDDALVQGSYHHGFAINANKLNSIAEEILTDPAFGFTDKVGLNPEEVLKEQAAPAAPIQPPPPAPAPAAAAGDSNGAAAAAPPPQQQQQQPLLVVVDPQKLAEAHKAVAALKAAHPNIELHTPAEWKKLVAAVGQRLKRVRQALADPNYVEPPTPNKPISALYSTATTSKPVNMGTTPAAAAAAAAVIARAGSVQQRLQLTPAGDGSMTYKGKKVIGSGLAVGVAAAPPQAAAARPAAAAAAGPARTPPAAQVYLPVQGLSPAQAQQLLLNQQRLINQQNAALAFNAARAAATLAAVNAAAHAQLQDKKRQAQEQLNGSTAKRPNNSSNGTNQQGLPAQRAALQAAEARRQQQQQQHEVVELLDDDDEDEQVLPPRAQGGAAAAATPAAAAAAGAAGVAARAVPSSGLVVRRLPAGADLSQEQSVDEPAGPGNGNAGAVSETPAAAGSVSASGKQHMQQLLGSSEPKAAGGSSERKAGGKAAAAAAAGDHPVYGTPAGAGAAAAGAAAAGTKRKHAKQEDTKQRKLNEWFAVAK